MPERRVSEVVPERRRLGQVFVELKCARDDPRDLRDLQRVRHTRAVMLIRREQKDLRLVHQPPERLGMQDTVAVALKLGAVLAGHIGVIPAARILGQKCVGRERLFFPFQENIRDPLCHKYPSFPFVLYGFA